VKTNENTLIGTTEATNLNFDGTTPIAPRGLGGLTRDHFGNGRLYAGVCAHGGLLRIGYWGNQHVGGSLFFQGEPGTAWIKLFRLFANIDGKVYYLTLNKTELFAFGYRSHCELDGIHFEHELILLPDAVAQRVRVVRGAKGRKIRIEMIHHESATAVGVPNREWSGFAFDKKANALITSCRDQNPTVYRGDDGAAQMGLGLEVKDSPDETTWIGLGCDRPAKASGCLHERHKHYLVSDPAAGGSAAYYTVFAPSRGDLTRRLKELSKTVHEECDRSIAQHDKRVGSRPQVRTGNLILDSAFAQIPEALHHMKVPDAPGATRSTLAGYFVWGWDGHAGPVPFSLANEADYAADILRFNHQQRHPRIGLPHMFTSTFEPRLKTAFSAQSLYIASLYHYIATTGDLDLVREVMPTCRFLLDRCREMQVGDTGLVSGISFWPDFPEGLEENNQDISSLNNSCLYQALRCMEYVGAALGDGEFAEDCARWAERLRRSFVKYLYDEEKGFFFSSCSSQTLKPRRHYASIAIFWVTPFARELVSHAPARIAAFMEEHLRAEKCLLSLPRWDTAWMADGNQFGASLPPIDYFYLNVHKLMAQPKALERWLGDVEWFWKQHTVPEAFTPEAENEHDIGPDNQGCKQYFTCSTWYACLYHGLAGLDFDHEGITFTPWGERELSIANLKLHGFSVDLSLKGKGEHLTSLTLNGKKLPAGSRKIAWSNFKAGRNKLAIVRTLKAPAHPVIVRADGLRVESVQTKTGGLTAQISGVISGEVMIAVNGKKTVRVDGKPVKASRDPATGSLTIPIARAMTTIEIL